MGFLSFLFGKEKEEVEPEILVLGAKLRCIYGGQESFLYIDTEDIDLNNLPEACVSDNQALFNILPFGQCYFGGPCEFLMQIDEEWENSEPQTKEINGKEVITTESTIECKASGLKIEVLESGQDGVFAEQIIFLREMDLLFPGLRELLEDPYGSLYLVDGMYEMAIEFLAEMLNRRGENIQLLCLDTYHSLQDQYISAAFERLLPYVDTREPGRFLAGLENAITKTGMKGVDAHYLSEDMIKVLQVDCKDYAQKVAKGGYYKWQEENKLFLNWLAEASTSMAYAALAYSSMNNANKNNNKTNKVTKDKSPTKKNATEKTSKSSASTKKTTASTTSKSTDSAKKTSTSTTSKSSTSTEAARKAKADILKANSAKGKAYEAAQVEEFKKVANQVEEQITIVTKKGTKFRIDAMGYNKNTNELILQEYKSSTSAQLTKNQNKGFPELPTVGGTVVGKGKGAFKGGFQIEKGTEVTVIRPQ